MDDLKSALNPKAMAEIDARNNFLLEMFNQKVYTQCKNTEERSYALCSITQDLLHMLFMHIQANMPTQEAKAALKVALDAILLNHGMHISIHEFKMD